MAGRTIRDTMKRSCGQAVNHITQAILDVNQVYEPFRDQHPEEAAKLEAIMKGLNICRDLLLMFVKVAWELDEDQLMSYL